MVTFLNSTQRIERRVIDKFFEDKHKFFKDKIVEKIKKGERIRRDEPAIKYLNEDDKRLLEPLFLENDLYEIFKKFLIVAEHITEMSHTIDWNYPYHCESCGCQSHRVILSYKCKKHYAKLSCNNCHRWGKWIKKEDVESRMTKPPKNLDVGDDYDCLDDALDIK